MSVEENKAIVRRWNDQIWSNRSLAAIDELLATDFVWYYPPPGVAPDREGYKKQVVTLAAFADVQCTVEDMVAEEDKVAIRWIWRGTHKGEYMGVAPTGKQVTITGISILRIVGGKIVEEWGESDMLGFMQQLGVVPAPE
jgi:steroid delta-isomerase-like uncharacterized protein